jgi:hypothetical protein
MKATYHKADGVWRKNASIWQKIGDFWVQQFPWRKHIGDWLPCWEVPITAPTTVFIVDSGSFTVTGAGMNLLTGEISFSHATSGVSNDVIIAVRVIHYITGQVNYVEYYNAYYTASTDLGSMTHVVFGPPIPSTGYIVRLEFYEGS